MLVQFEDFLQFFGREVLIKRNVLTFAVLEDTVGNGTAAGASVQFCVCPDFVSQIFRKLGDVVTDSAEVLLSHSEPATRRFLRCHSSTV